MSALIHGRGKYPWMINFHGWGATYAAPTSARSFLFFLLYPDLRFPKIAGTLGLCSTSGIVEECLMCICGLMANLIVEYQLLANHKFGCCGLVVARSSLWVGCSGSIAVGLLL